MLRELATVFEMSSFQELWPPIFSLDVWSSDAKIFCCRGVDCTLLFPRKSLSYDKSEIIYLFIYSFTFTLQLQTIISYWGRGAYMVMNIFIRQK